MASSGATHGDLVSGFDSEEQDDIDPLVPSNDGEMNDDNGDEVSCNDGDRVGGDLDDQVHAVKSSVTAAKTVDMYRRGISRYLSWLYQNKRNVLSNTFLALVPADNLQNDGDVVSLSSDSIYRIITANPLLTPITYDLHRAHDFEQFFVSLRNQKGEKPGMSVYDSLRSRLFHLYRDYACTIPEAFAADLTLFFKGLKRTVARRSHASGQKLTEGKEPPSFSVLRFSCVAMMKHHTDEYVFAHTFLLISWNFMCRAGSTVGIHAANMRWDGNAVAIVFGHMKNDQEGTRPRDARHVYANPFMPEICPALSLAVYSAVCGLSNSLLFTGRNQYNRFSKILKRIMVEQKVKVLLESEGLTPYEIGTHSARKGSATYVSSCSNGGPSAAAICIRAGWTLPGVQNTYIRYEAAGDRIVGRYAACLPFGQAGFASLPPFIENCDDEIRRSIELCFPNIPSHLIPAGSFFLASLMYHHNFLTATLHDKHPLYQNALFGNTRLVNRLKARINCRIASSTDRIRPMGVRNMYICW